MVTRDIFRNTSDNLIRARIPLCGIVLVETSWYSTEDTIYDIAVVHTKSKGKKQGELHLRPGDVITDLQKTNIPGFWKVKP